MDLYLKLDYWGPHVSLDHDCGRGRPTIACFCFLKCNSKNSPQKKSMPISSCPVLLPTPPSLWLFFFFPETQQTSPPLQPVPSTLGAMFTGTPMFASNVAINWWWHRSSVEGPKTVRRDYRMDKIRLFSIYGGIPKTLVLSGTRPKFFNRSQIFWGEFSSSKHRFSGANCWFQGRYP